MKGTRTRNRKKFPVLVLPKHESGSSNIFPEGDCDDIYSFLGISWHFFFLPADFLCSGHFFSLIKDSQCKNACQYALEALTTRAQHFGASFAGRHGRPPSGERGCRAAADNMCRGRDRAVPGCKRSAYTKKHFIDAQTTNGNGRLMCLILS